MNISRKSLSHGVHRKIYLKTTQKKAGLSSIYKDSFISNISDKIFFTLPFVGEGISHCPTVIFLQIPCLHPDP